MGGARARRGTHVIADGVVHLVVGVHGARVGDAAAEAETARVTCVRACVPRVSEEVRRGRGLLSNAHFLIFGSRSNDPETPDGQVAIFAAKKPVTACQLCTAVVTVSGR
jgi:hypothetical protein